MESTMHNEQRLQWCFTTFKNIPDQREKWKPSLEQDISLTELISRVLLRPNAKYNFKGYKFQKEQLLTEI